MIGTFIKDMISRFWSFIGSLFLIQMEGSMVVCSIRWDISYMRSMIWEGPLLSHLKAILNNWRKTC